MLQKNSFTVPSDTSGVFLSKVIQTRRCSSRKHAKTGKFLRSVIRETKTKIMHRRKQRVRSIVIRTSHPLSKSDGLTYIFEKNAIVLLKRRMNVIGKEVIGPSCRCMKIKKFRNSILAIY